MAANEDGTPPIRLVVIDDHEAVLDGIARLFNAEPGLEVVGQATTAQEGRGLVAALRPDVAVLDLRLPDAPGSELLAYFSAAMPSLRCVVHTGAIGEEQERALIDAGAARVVLKSLRGSDLLEAVLNAGRRVPD